MTRTPTRPAATPASRDRLGLLVDRIAAGDRVAFRSLYALLAMRILRDSTRALSHAADSRAVTRSTFVEVWHLAGDHVADSRADTRVWIATITARRIEERLRTPDRPCPTLDAYDSHVRRELTDLLGSGPITIRTGTASFLRMPVIDLDLIP